MNSPLIIKCNLLLPSEEMEQIRKKIKKQWEENQNEVVILPAGFELAKPIGKWKKILPANIFECSECGQNVMTNNIDCYKFCHNCGAIMKGE